MSQNKTIVPGMESGHSYEKEPPADFYSKGANTRTTTKGTVVPGMDYGHNTAQRAQDSASTSQHSSYQSGKPVAGFLYSISRQGIGEYWPLYLGQNTIGSSPNCNICLCEGTVSNEHAVLVVRKMKNPEKTIASISDARSTNGTMLNAESLGFSAVECFNGDIITVGENYELVLLLIDVKALGLRVSENFIPTESHEANVEEHEHDPYSPGYTQPGGMMPPKFDNRQDMYSSSYGSTDGTVGMDGGNGIKSGGTVGM